MEKWNRDKEKKSWSGGQGWREGAGGGRKTTEAEKEKREGEGGKRLSGRRGKWSDRRGNVKEFVHRFGNSPR